MLTDDQGQCVPIELPMIGGPGFAHEVPVDIDSLDRVIPILAELSGNAQLYQVSQAERQAAKGHVDDLREVTRALLEMQRVIVGRRSGE